MAISWVDSLQTPGVCQDCGSSLARGIRAVVDDESGFVWCEACALKRNAPDPDTGDSNQDAEGLTPEAMQNLWQRFYTYQASCLKADLIEGLAQVSGKRWVCINDNYETVISQGDRLLPLGPDLDRLVGRMLSSQSLQYGWPLVALETREGLKVAPLLVVDLAPPPYPGNSISVYGDPVINPSLLRAMWSHSGDISFLRSQMGEKQPVGAVAMARFAQRICSIMGLQCPELDSYDLRREMPTEPGVYNSAVAVVVEGTPTVRSVVEELRLAASAKDWHNTAASCLFGIETPDIEGRDNMPVMPWSAETVFEEALQMVRKKSLTVFDMAKRDIIDQLIVSTCANAWMDGESVLVVSSDEKKLDELANLAADVHSGMLIRTFCDADKESNPNRKCSSISDIAQSLLDECNSTKNSIASITERANRELATAEELRKVAIDGSGRRSAILAEKQQLETKRLDAAKRIWTHGLYPPGTDPLELAYQAKALGKSWLFSGLRTKLFLNSMKSKSGATLKDVVNWCEAALSIKNLEAGLKDLSDMDKYNVGAANYRWAANSIGAVSARISNSLINCVTELEELTKVHTRDLRARRAVSNSVPFLKCWASDYQTANVFFKLQANLFDVLILDNSSKVNLGWALPLAYRAKRIIVIGDPSGVAPSIFLDDLQLSSMAQRYEFDRETMLERCLDYQNSSVYAAFSHV